MLMTRSYYRSWVFPTLTTVRPGPPKLLAATIATSLESAPSLLRAKDIFGHTIYIHIAICFIHKVPPLLPIHALHIRIAHLINSASTPRTKPASTSSSFHLRLVRFFSQPLPTHALHISPNHLKTF